MYYKIVNPNTKQLLLEIDKHLEDTCVKGDSVKSLFLARMGFKQLIESMIEVKEEKENPSKKNDSKEEAKQEEKEG